MPGPPSSADDLAQREELERQRAWLWETVERLRGGRDDLNFRILVLYYLGRKSDREIAEELGIPYGRVRDRMWRALNKLRKELASEAGPQRGKRGAKRRRRKS